MTYFSEPISFPPWLKIERKRNRAEPAETIKIYPKLAATPSKIRWSSNELMMATVSDLRRENIGGIGSPGEDPPVGGIRVFSKNDRFLFLGGEIDKAPVLYERTGPTFQNTNVITLPAVPVFYTHAVFSYDGHWLFAVRSGAPAVVELYEWSGATPEDVDATWAYDSSINTGLTIERLRMSPQGTYLIVDGASGYKLYDPGASVTEHTSKPAGWCRGIREDESQWIIEPASSSSPMEIYDFAAGAFTLDRTLVSSQGTERRAEFSPTEEIICLMHKPTSGGTPVFYADIDDSWVVTSVHARSGASGTNANDPVFSSEGDQILIGLNTGGLGAVELYEQGTITPPPLENVTNDMPFEMTAPTTSFSSASLDGTLYIIDDPTTDIRIIRLSDVAAPVEITRPAAMNGGHYSSMSTDGSIVAVDSKIFKFDGISTFTQLSITGMPATQIDRIEVSRNGKYFAMFFRKAAPTYGSLRFFERDLVTDAITVIGSDFDFNINYSPTRNAVFSPVEDLLISNVAISGTFRTWRLSGGVFVAGGDLPGGPYSAVQQSAAFSPDGSLIAILTGSAPVAMKVLKRQTDGSFLVLYTSPTLSATGNGIFIRFAPDGRAVAASLSATPFFAFFEVDAGVVAPAALPVVMPASVASLVWGPEALYVLQTGTDLKYEYSHMVEYPTFTMAQSFAVDTVDSTPPEIWGFAPTNPLMHFGLPDDPQHRPRTAPYTEVTALYFEPDWPANQIWDVVYGHTGRVVVASTPDGPTLATRGGGGDFLNTKEINGIFVTLYDLDGTVFEERDYVWHVRDSIVRDIQFSKTNKVFTYHVNLPSGAPVDASRGRLIYDITGDRYDFRGDVYNADMDGSFIAFSPWETHFVVTEHYPVAASQISLHKFLDDYYFEDNDVKPVAYGPPAFSMCDDVVVAHGGLPPFTFFKHDRDDEILIPQATEVEDWDIDGVILDIEWTEGCDGLVAITPDEIINIPQDEDTGEFKPTEPTELDAPADEDSQIDPDNENPNQWNVSPGKPTDGGIGYPGGYELNPDDEVFYGLNFVPYSVVTVTIRVRPVPL